MRPNPSLALIISVMLLGSAFESARAVSAHPEVTARCGVINESGRELIPLTHENLQQALDEGAGFPKDAAFKDGTDYFNNNGEPISPTAAIQSVVTPLVVPPNFKRITGSYYGSVVSPTTTGAEKLGFLGRKGKLTIPCEFDKLRFVGSNRLVATRSNPKNATAELSSETYLYSTEGRRIAKLPDYADGVESYYNEGLLLIGDDTRRAYINLNGALVIPPNKFWYKNPFYSGLTDIAIGPPEKRQFAWVNRKNKIVVGPYSAASIGPFQDGLGPLLKTSPNGRLKTGAVDTNGKLVFPVEFDMWDSSCSHFVLGKRNGQFALYSKSTGALYSKMPDNAVAVWANDFEKNDIVPFNVGGTEPDPSQSSNTAFDGKWGYCDLHGNVIIKPTFESAGTFNGRSAVASITDKYGDFKYGLINKEGNWIVPPTYDSLQNAGTDRFLAMKSSVNGLVRRFRYQKHRSLELFGKILQVYDLIGMTEEELEQVLGKEGNFAADSTAPSFIHKTIMYDLTPHVKCGNAGITVIIGIDSAQRVAGWRFCEMDRQWNWNFKNGISADKSFATHEYIEQ